MNDNIIQPIIINNHQVSSTIQIQQFTKIDMNIRGAIINGAPYLCYNDICDAVGITIYHKKEFTQQLDYEYNLVLSNGMNPGPYYYRYIDVQTSQGIRPILFVSEGAFYRIITRATTDKALLFQHWVCDEVLPKLCTISGGSQDVVNEGLNRLMEMTSDVRNQVNLYTDHMDCSYSDTKDLLEDVNSNLIGLRETMDDIQRRLQYTSIYEN